MITASGFGYTTCEALSLGTPVIVTPVESFLEIGVKDGENGFVVDWNLDNVNVQEIYKKRLKFDYSPPKTTWKDVIAKGKSTYTPETDKEAIYITTGYFDMELNKWVEPTSVSDDWLRVSKERAKYLVKNGVARYE